MLGTSYKTKEVFIRSNYYYYCEKPVCMRRTVTQFACESVGLCSFCGPYMREFEFSHSNPVSRIIKISYAHNLQVNKLDFFLLRFVRKRTQILYSRRFAQMILRNHLSFTTSAIKLCFMQC